MRRAERSIQAFTAWAFPARRRTSWDSRAQRRGASTDVLKEAAVNLGWAFLGLLGAYSDRDRIPPCLIRTYTTLIASGSMFCKVSTFDKACNCRFGKFLAERPSDCNGKGVRSREAGVRSSRDLTGRRGVTQRSASPLQQRSDAAAREADGFLGSLVSSSSR
jgi:hypothetical protein